MGDGGVERRRWGKFTASGQEIDAAVIRHGGPSAAADALGITPHALAHHLMRAFSLSGTGSAASRVTLRRLIAALGLETVASEMGDAPPDAVRGWAEKGLLCGSVRRAIDRVATAHGLGTSNRRDV